MFGGTPFSFGYSLEILFMSHQFSNFWIEEFRTAKIGACCKALLCDKL
jgi:hypothetical protein